MIRATVRFVYPELKRGQAVTLMTQPTCVFRPEEFQGAQVKNFMLHAFFIGSGKSQLGEQKPIKLSDIDYIKTPFDTCFRELHMAITVEALEDLPAGVLSLRGITAAGKAVPIDITKHTWVAAGSVNSKAPVTP